MKTDRRKLIKALTLGGGAVTVAKLPSTWTTPVVDSVTLPAHAQTTIGPALSGGTSITLEESLLPGFHNFVRAPGNRLLDRLIETAHADVLEPQLISARISGYAERDVSRGAGWWLVQILASYEVEFEENFGINTAPGVSPLDHLLKPAHAGPSNGFELSRCVTEVLWEARLLIDQQDGDRFRSGWRRNLEIDAQCGALQVAEDMPPTNAIVDMRIEDADDPNNASTAQVVVRQGGGGPLVARVRLSPGGSRLSVNCGGDECGGELIDALPPPQPD